MSTSSGENQTRRRAFRNCATFIFLSFICFAWNTVDAQSTTHTSQKDTSSSDHYASTETVYDFNRPTFDQAAKYIYEKVEQLQHRLASDLKDLRNIRQENANAYSSQEPINRDEKHFDQSRPSSDTSCESLKFVCDATQHVWRMFTPSTRSFAQQEQTEDDAASVDKALEQIRGIIHILGRTHNALLEKKIANRPLLQKLWVKYLHFYKDPYFVERAESRRAKFRNVLSDFVRSESYSDLIFGKSDSIRKTIIETLGKQVLQSVSALKESLRKTAERGWLMTPRMHPYVEEVSQTFKALSVKWLQKIASLADRTGPITDRLPSHEQVQQFIKGFEDTISEFKEEMWRSRTEWMYQRGEALSWAKVKADDFKRRATYESDRASENLNVWAQTAKQTLKEGLERSRKALRHLRVRASEQLERLVVIMQPWFSVATSFIGNYSRLRVLYASNLWRILALIAVIALFRFLLGFVLPDEYPGSVPGQSISTLDANDSANHGSNNAAHKQPETIFDGAPTRSETSESRPRQKTLGSERKSPPNTSKPSRVRGSTSPDNNKPVKPRVQRRERRPVAKAGNERTHKQTKPLQVSNLHYQNTQTSLEKQMNGRPIHLGDHEVQLVYEDVPRDGAKDAQGNGVGAKRTPAAAKTTRLQRTSRAGEKQPEVTARTGNDDDAITVSSNHDSTARYGSPNSRLTRASLRRGSARQSQAP